jgi:phage antirepressor YoqD-like protein
MENQERKKPDGFKCKFCNREFKSVKTLGAHMCEQKRRHTAQNEKHVQLGFRAFQRFHELNSTAIKPKQKSFDDFRTSQFYLGFIKFGRFAKDVNCLQHEIFVDWLVKHNLKLDDWAKDGAYELFVREYTINESANEALERSIKFMHRWGEREKKNWTTFFKDVGPNIFTYWVRTGRLSPWVVFNCEAGQSALNRLSDEQIGLVADALDPNFWYKKFQNNQDEVTFVRTILTEAGL